MAENPLEGQIKAAVHEMRRRMSIVDRAVPAKTVPVGKRQLTAEELFMRDSFVPGFREQSVSQASWEDANKYYRLIAKGRESFEKKHGDLSQY